jgi:hypothetical protein
VTRRHPKRRMTGEHFAAIPFEVLESEAVCTLPNFALRVLVVLAGHYRGNNNGDLAMTRAIARRFGVRSHVALVRGLALLQERGLIQKTHQGGKRPWGPCLYALTWRPIDDLRGKIEIGPTVTATNAWAKWTPLSHSPGKNEQARRQPASDTPVGLKDTTSGLQVGHEGPLVRPSEGPPSRSPREARWFDPADLDGSRTITAIRDPSSHSTGCANPYPGEWDT